MYLLIVVASGVVAQEPPKLKIVILQGDGDINNARQRVAREPIVQVTDEEDRPIAGAYVTFTLPANGPGGTFASINAKTLTVVTDATGRAQASAIQLNNTAGNFNINVTASHQGRTAQTVIHQRIQPVSGSGSGSQSGASAGSNLKWIIIVAVAGGGAAAAARALGGKKGGSPAPSPPVAPRSATISIGTGSVGPPQ